MNKRPSWGTHATLTNRDLLDFCELRVAVLPREDEGCQARPPPRQCQHIVASSTARSIMLRRQVSLTVARAPCAFCNIRFPARDSDVGDLEAVAGAAAAEAPVAGRYTGCPGWMSW